MRRLPGLQDRRCALYQAMEDAMIKLKSNKNVADFQASLKKIANDQKNETPPPLWDPGHHQENVNPDLGEKVSELQRK